MNIIKKSLLSLFVVLLCTSCAKQKIDKKIKIYDQEIEQKTEQIIEQKPSYYTKNITPISSKSKKSYIKKFEKNYFYPWHIRKITFSQKDAMWGQMYSKMDVFSENLTPIPKAWFNNIIDASNFLEYDTIRRKAITISNSHLKVFPTISKIFYDPNQAGEGFPFDYNENSSIKLNTPLFVSHLSKDKLWVFVESSVAIGWIKVSDIAYVENKFIKTFENGDYYTSLKDDVNILKNKYLIGSVSLGTLFPKAKNGFIIAAKDYRNKGFIRVIDKNKNFAKLGIELNLKNIKKLSKELIGERYGWGGVLGNRDCSLMIKDFYTPFGIFLNRNSRMQKYNGKPIDLTSFDNKEKKNFILKNAIPFKTLIYLPGHIMIYVGEHNNEPLVFHNIWGVKTIDSNGKEGRNIIGKAIVSTLNPGNTFKNYSNKFSLLNRIESITTIIQ